MGKLEVERIVLGAGCTNCWLAFNRETKEVVLIDPADEAQRVEAKIKKSGLVPVAILLTHGHYDHIGAVEKLKETYGILCYAHEAEAEVLENPAFNLTLYHGSGYALYPDRLLRDGETLGLGGFQVRVIHTPGHTKGGACYQIEGEHVVFCGDTVFQASVGRTDLPTGNMSQLVRSVRSLLKDLPDDTVLCPGHGEETTIAYEKRYNPFI